MRMPFLKLAAGVLAACALGGPASPSARADFLSSYTGNTQLSNGTPQGVVSFSVFDNTSGGSWLTAINKALGFTGSNASQALSASSLTGGGSIDLNAKYVYIYQVVNIANSTPTLNSLQVTKGGFTSAGYISGKVFEDPWPNGVVGTKPGGKLDSGLGTDPTSGDTSDTQPSVSGVTGGRYAGLSYAINPSSVDLSGTGFVTFTFPSISGTSGGTPHDTTSLVFLTSNYAPGYAKGQIGSSSSTSDGGIPRAVTPEPGTLVLCGAALFCFVGAYVRRRKSLATAAVAA